MWGPPGLGKVNGRYTVARGRLIKSHDYRAWCALAKSAMSFDAGSWSGPVIVTIAVYWARAHRTGPAAGLAFGDVDALAKATLDSLQSAGTIEDDAQVVVCKLTKHVAKNKTQERVEITITEAPHT